MSRLLFKHHEEALGLVLECRDRNWNNSFQPVDTLKSNTPLELDIDACLM